MPPAVLSSSPSQWPPQRLGSRICVGAVGCIGRSHWRTGHLAKTEARHNVELAGQRKGMTVKQGAYGISGTAVGDYVDMVCSEKSEHCQ